MGRVTNSQRTCAAISGVSYQFYYAFIIIIIFSKGTNEWLESLNIHRKQNNFQQQKFIQNAYFVAITNILLLPCDNIYAFVGTFWHLDEHPHWWRICWFVQASCSEGGQAHRMGQRNGTSKHTNGLCRNREWDCEKKKGRQHVPAKRRYPSTGPHTATTHTSTVWTITTTENETFILFRTSLSSRYNYGLPF